MEDWIRRGTRACSEVEAHKPVAGERVQEGSEEGEGLFWEGELAEVCGGSQAFPVGNGKVQDAIFEVKTLKEGHAVAKTAILHRQGMDPFNMVEYPNPTQGFWGGRRWDRGGEQGSRKEDGVVLRNFSWM